MKNGLLSVFSVFSKARARAVISLFWG
jgi:hypothetical protein